MVIQDDLVSGGIVRVQRVVVMSISMRIKKSFLTHRRIVVHNRMKQKKNGKRDCKQNVCKKHCKGKLQFILDEAVKHFQQIINDFVQHNTSAETVSRGIRNPMQITLESNSIPITSFTSKGTTTQVPKRASYGDKFVFHPRNAIPTEYLQHCSYQEGFL